MKIVYDEPKRQTNIDKHGLDFASLNIDFFEGALVVEAHSRRFKAIGAFQDGTIAVVFATLGTEAVSLISMRPASKLKRELYDQYR